MDMTRAPLALALLAPLTAPVAAQTSPPTTVETKASARVDHARPASWEAYVVGVSAATLGAIELPYDVTFTNTGALPLIFGHIVGL